MGCTNKNEWKPVLINYDFKADLIGISCGYYHTLFLTNNGNVFACGNNRYNQTQRNNQGFYSSDDDQGIFQIKALKNITHIKCGGFSSYAIDKDKTIHSFGYNDSGECGCGFTGTIENIQKLANINCITLDSGSFHVGCLTDNNSIYMFGYNANGQCGNSLKTSYHRPTKLNIKISCSFIDVKCGNTFSIIKTSNNDYYGFGNNGNSQCLLNNKTSHLLPTKIDLQSIKNILKCNNDIIHLIPAVDQTYILQSIY